ncbi:SpoIIAA family protein [Gilvimarinus polysaccharolyticus]|uniref:STAS/SEC14 domain-containing protein n=1 Tax=Gilvimarinus polysaccharolyticus TaxID=863921 RepID=UPI0006738AF8|nr:STAS/SEC14 domain-containing protein [Gilvimarinus polysaccharolyticus]
MNRHGFHIGIERIDNYFFLSLKVSGKLTHEDYQKITPLLDNALAGLEDPDLMAYVDIRELEGWELRAAWDDFKLGAKHRKAFKRVAIVGDQRWIDVASKVGGWFIAGKMEHFDDPAAALAWLSVDQN